MDANPREILDKVGDSEWFKRYIGQSQTAITADMNQTRVAAMVLVAESLRRSADASERHARGLKWATWALVGVTGVLAIGTIVPLFR